MELKGVKKRQLVEAKVKAALMLGEKLRDSVDGTETSWS